MLLSPSPSPGVAPLGWDAKETLGEDTDAEKANCNNVSDSYNDVVLVDNTSAYLLLELALLLLESDKLSRVAITMKMSV